MTAYKLICIICALIMLNAFINGDDDEIDN